jgi:periplasmic divalent cation tolerance protein
MNAETDVLVVFCTFPDIGQARQIGTLLVERQLAACVNLVASVESIYRWEGVVETAAEVLGVIKTTRAAYPALEAAVRTLHPYQVPEVVALPVMAGLAAYLQWVAGETAGH